LNTIKPISTGTPPRDAFTRIADDGDNGSFGTGVDGNVDDDRDDDIVDDKEERPLVDDRVDDNDGEWDLPDERDDIDDECPCDGDCESLFNGGTITVCA